MDISQITDDLFIGTQPQADDYARLHGMGITLVINMRGEHRPPEHAQSQIESLWLKTYDTPFTPIPLEKLAEGARAATAAIERGGKVFAHCAGGRHRSAAMVAAILIAQEHTAEAAMDMVAARHAKADPRLWYVRRQIRRFEQFWRDGRVPPFDPFRIRSLIFGRQS
ncbi:MAG: dual specificity protein phosphatase family protein [Chloroflexi bacterium]|nr:dual specificity protein phosphatase family protein [Chloroflexota bacterium]